MHSLKSKLIFTGHTTQLLKDQTVDKTIASDTESNLWKEGVPSESTRTLSHNIHDGDQTLKNNPKSKITSLETTERSFLGRVQSFHLFWMRRFEDHLVSEVTLLA